MFSGCSNLESLPDISKWDTSNVILMGGIFTNLSSLSSISIEEAIKYEKKERKKFLIGGILGGCSSLTYLPDISKWNTNNVTNMYGIFGGCSSLAFLPDISKWNTNNITNMSYMFYNCKDGLNIPSKFL